MSSLAAAALAIAKQQLALGVRGGATPFGRFRGLQVDQYQRAVGLPLSPDPTQMGYPWCAAAVYWCFAQVAGSGPNPCPRTAGAVKIWNAAQDAHGTHSPAPGCVFVLDRGEGKGHVGFVDHVNPDGSLHTVEPDTSSRVLSATGDAWGEHDWDPADGKRGTLLGYLLFDGPAAPLAA